MTLERYVYAGTKRLRCGYTTGSCAALATQAACRMLLGEPTPERVALTTPSGVRVEADVVDATRAKDGTWARCAIQKDAGDDVDATDGLLIYADVRLVDSVAAGPSGDMSAAGCTPDVRPGSGDRGLVLAPGGAPVPGGDDASALAVTPVTERALDAHAGAHGVGPVSAAPALDVTAERDALPANSESTAGVRLLIRGGEGVGRVTRPGLEQPVGEAAINSVPRAMIAEQAGTVLAAYGIWLLPNTPECLAPDATCSVSPDIARAPMAVGAAGAAQATPHIPVDSPCPSAPDEAVPYPAATTALTVESVPAQPMSSLTLVVTISVPGGEQVAARTFNPQLGIEGGISILGTTGIVEPRSVAALVDSIELEMRQHAAEGARDLVLVPGNYGRDFVAAYLPQLVDVPLVSCSNYLGDALDFAARHGFERVLLVGHIGKLAKVAGGVMNTHSRVADCRCEIICAHAALAGADRDMAHHLMACATTEACLDVLDEAGLLAPVVASLTAAIADHVERRVAGAYETAVILFSQPRAELARTPNATALIATMTSLSK